jgi:hypothetical protein
MKVSRWLVRFLRNLATQDVCCVVFHAYMFVRMLCAPASANASLGRLLTLLLLSFTLLTIVLVRGELLPPGRARALLYRLGMIAPIPLSYLSLRVVLPALRPQLLDDALLRLDQALLADTPARLWEAYVSTTTVEWFAFFYYSYFTLMVLHVLGSALLDRGPRMAELLFAAMLIAALGHVGYTLVPAAGPVAALRFQTDLNGGWFWQAVQNTVNSAGAKLDVFPSLHTALPTLFMLHSIRHRRSAPFRYTWVPLTFAVLNIIIATMFLRWHYAVDILAGLALSVFSQQVAIRVASWEDQRAGTSQDAQDPHGPLTAPHRQPIWEPLYWSASAAHAGSARTEQPS